MGSGSQPCDAPCRKPRSKPSKHGTIKIKMCTCAFMQALRMSSHFGGIHCLQLCTNEMRRKQRKKVISMKASMIMLHVSQCTQLNVKIKKATVHEKRAQLDNSKLCFSSAPTMRGDCHAAPRPRWRRHLFEVAEPATSCRTTELLLTQTSSKFEEETSKCGTHIRMHYHDVLTLCLASPCAHVCDLGSTHSRLLWPRMWAGGRKGGDR